MSCHNQQPTLALPFHIILAEKSQGHREVHPLYLHQYSYCIITSYSASLKVPYTQRPFATFWSDNLPVLVDAGAEMGWMAVLSHFTRTCKSPQEKERRAYPNKYVAIFYLWLYQCNLMKVHGALVEKTRGEEGSHNLRPLRPALVSAAFHQSPLEVAGFEGWKHQSTSRLAIF